MVDRLEIRREDMKVTHRSIFRGGRLAWTGIWRIEALDAWLSDTLDDQYTVWQTITRAPSQAPVAARG